MHHARRPRLFSFVLFVLAAASCAVPVDDEAPAASSEALSGTADVGSLSSQELAPAVDETDTSIDGIQIDPTQTEISSSTCRRVCACCARNGNRFCCSHCRFCSGPIGTVGGVGEVLSP